MPITEALAQAHTWLAQQGVFQHEFVFMSCGDFDGKHLKRESERKNLTVPNYLKRWINLKKAFPVHIFDSTKQALDFSSPQTIVKLNRPVIGGMPEML